MDPRSHLVRVYGTAALAAVSFLGGPAGAQIRSTAPPIELEETTSFGMGARALGLGRAYVAVGEDASAIAYNPAALAQIRQIEFSAGLAHDDVTHSLARSAGSERDRTSTRLEHLAFAYPYPTYRGSLVLAGAFHRFADLERDLFLLGYAEPPSGGSFGEVEVEDVLQTGSVNAWSGAIGWDVSPNLSVGGSLTYISGGRRLDRVLARGIPDPAAGGCEGAEPDEYGLYYGCGDASEAGLFKAYDRVDADLEGYTGSIGVLSRFDNGVRLGLSLDFPKWLKYQGSYTYEAEDYEFFYADEGFFEDEITLPLSVKAGLSWGRSGFLLAGGVQWTDWSQIDFEGDILGPDRDPAYRSTAALQLGAEYQIPNVPLRVRAGYFTEPLPYELIAADMVLTYDPGSDGIPDTDDDLAVVNRYYPRSDITSDRTYWSLGAGVLVQEALSLDAAFVHGSWERRTPDGFETGTSPDGLATREKVEQNRLFVSATFHFQ